MIYITYIPYTYPVILIKMAGILYKVESRVSIFNYIGWACAGPGFECCLWPLFTCKRMAKVLLYAPKTMRDCINLLNPRRRKVYGRIDGINAEQKSILVVVILWQGAPQQSKYIWENPRNWFHFEYDNAALLLPFKKVKSLKGRWEKMSRKKKKTLESI